MNTEKENELNEQELWDLLKEPVETEMPAPPKKDKSRKKEKPEKKVPAKVEEPAAEESESKTNITDRRKKALVWYLVGLFGIAFAVVLISLVLRGDPGNAGSTNPSGEDSVQVQELYDRINELEDRNAELEEANTALEEENKALNSTVLEQELMMDGLNVMIDELTQSLEYVEGSNLYEDENREQLRRTMEAYETLVRAQNAFIDYDEEVLNQAMAYLQDNLDLLSEEAVNAYFMVIEYMEQPYLGQE